MVIKTVSNLKNILCLAVIFLWKIIKKINKQIARSFPRFCWINEDGARLRVPIITAAWFYGFTFGRNPARRSVQRNVLTTLRTSRTQTQRDRRRRGDSSDDHAPTVELLSELLPGGSGVHQSATSRDPRAGQSLRRRGRGRARTNGVAGYGHATTKCGGFWLIPASQRRRKKKKKKNNPPPGAILVSLCTDLHDY